MYGQVSAVLDWAVPDSRKLLQHFLGLANFYLHYIQNYNSLAVPLTSLNSMDRSFVWTPEADKSFWKLKEWFTSAPILQIPDYTRHFMVKVDASDVGIGVVLSERTAVHQKLHPCAFFSPRHLSLKVKNSKSNYDIGNFKLLEVNLALEKWRHWLQLCQLLNSRQAWWALFFTRFNLTLLSPPNRGMSNVMLIPSSLIVGKT